MALDSPEGPGSGGEGCQSPSQGPADSRHSVNGVAWTPWTGDPRVPNIPSSCCWHRPSRSFFRGTLAEHLLGTD